MKWTIVAFRHPDTQKSLVYKQGLSRDGLLKAVALAESLGANLMSIRGFGTKTDQRVFDPAAFGFNEGDDESP